MPPFGCLLLGPVIMAITLWTLAGTGPEHEPKADTPQVGGATEEGSEQGETGVESAEEKSEPYEAEKVEVEDKVCLNRLSSNIHIQFSIPNSINFFEEQVERICSKIKAFSLR